MTKAPLKTKVALVMFLLVPLFGVVPLLGLNMLSAAAIGVDLTMALGVAYAL